MFGRTKKGPDRPFTHTDDCKIVKVSPDSRSSGRRFDVASGRPSASAGRITTMSQSPTVVSGWTPTTRQRSDTRPSTSSRTSPIRCF